LFCEVANGVVEGSCEPVLIHADKSKTKEKGAQERVRQQNGQALNTTVTSEQWTVELDNIPDIPVEMTNSGSMTQEQVFFVYAKHLVEVLPSGHRPVIFFLVGHESYWNQDALQAVPHDIVCSPLSLQVIPVSGHIQMMLVLIRDFTVQ